MARINIEDSLYKDTRFSDLYIKLGSVETALGALIRVWTVAQEYYLKDDRKIPKSVWVQQRLNNEVLNCGLATEKNERIEVAGADEQFKWLLQRVEAGRKGGQAKGKQDHNLPESERIKRAGSRSILAKAVQNGTIEKPEFCQDCGKTDCIIEGHHDDYEKPLDVIWLCKQCHTETHRNIRLATANLPQSSANRSLADTKPSSPTLSLSLTPTLIQNSNSNNLIITPEPEKKRKLPTQAAKAVDVVEFKISSSKSISIKKDLITAWSDTYPKEYLDLSVKELRNWVLSNEHKAPKSAWAKFMNSWFQRGWERYRTTLKSQPTKLTTDDLNEILGAGL